jgi:GTP cyclohydrolase IA
MECHNHKNKEPKTKTINTNSISEIIRSRLIEAKADYKANTNISEYVLPGELELLQKEVENKFQALLESLIIDTKNDHNTNETAHRVAKMYIQEIFSGRYNEIPKVTAFPNVSKYDQLYVIGPIEVRSLCAHHFMPIVGSCFIGVAPGADVIGLSKFSRLAHWICERPSIQEETTMQLADLIEKETQAPGIAVVIKAEHLCLTHRGVKSHESQMVTSVMRGMFRDETNNLKAEFLSILNSLPGYKN